MMLDVLMFDHMRSLYLSSRPFCLPLLVLVDLPWLVLMVIGLLLLLGLAARFVRRLSRLARLRLLARWLSLRASLHLRLLWSLYHLTSLLLLLLTSVLTSCVYLLLQSLRRGKRKPRKQAQYKPGKRNRHIL